MIDIRYSIFEQLLHSAYEAEGPELAHAIERSVTIKALCGVLDKVYEEINRRMTENYLAIQEIKCLQ